MSSTSPRVLRTTARAVKSARTDASAATEARDRFKNLHTLPVLADTVDRLTKVVTYGQQLEFFVNFEERLVQYAAASEDTSDTANGK